MKHFLNKLKKNESIITEVVVITKYARATELHTMFTKWWASPFTALPREHSSEEQWTLSYSGNQIVKMMVRIMIFSAPSVCNEFVYNV